MKKEIAVKGILGFICGVFFCCTIAIIVSLFLNTGEFYPVDPTLIDKTGSVLKAVIFQYAGIGIIGSVMGISSILFEKDEWSILFQTAVHFLISASCIIAYLLLIRTDRAGISQAILYLALLSAIYIMIWLYRITSCYIKIRKIKKKLLFENGEMTKADKKNLLMIRIFIVLVLVSVVFTAPYFGIQKIRINMVKTTDLSQIAVDGISIGEDASLLDFSNYTETDSYNQNFKYRFDELVFDTDAQNKISYIFSRFDEGKAGIIINGADTSESIDDITQILGADYYEKNYDKEQMLKEHIYYDRVNHVTAEFIYADFGDDSLEDNNKLCWIKIFRN